MCAVYCEHTGAEGGILLTSSDAAASCTLYNVCRGHLKCVTCKCVKGALLFTSSDAGAWYTLCRYSGQHVMYGGQCEIYGARTQMG